MSWQAMDAIDRLPYDATGPLAFRVLAKLANVADQNGERAFRGKFLLAEELGVSARSIQRAYAELEAGGQIIPGDQRFTAHLRNDRRPTVYNINMGTKTAYEQQLEANFDDDDQGETHGETQLSTGSHGETHGETTVVAHRELIELTIDNTSRRNHTGSVSPWFGCGTPFREHELLPDGKYCGICARIHPDFHEGQASA